MEGRRSRRSDVADSATYLYAITRDAGGTATTEVTGVAGTDVRAVTQSGLRAYVSTVPLNQFDEAALRRNLEDLAWLEATARAHHGVVEAVSRTAPTAPVRLVTVYRGDDHVRRMLDERAGEFEGVLADIAGRTEWGVKVYATGGRSIDRPGDAAGDAGMGAERRGPGTAYLQRRRTSLRSREDARRRALARAEQIDATLAAIAVASRRHRPQDPQLSGRDEWMVLNGSYLVDEDRGDEFSVAVESFRTRDVELHVTGPWAPYSFAILENP
jgi:Gas vesicle synthesis protein GvpL/GvpF